MWVVRAGQMRKPVGNEWNGALFVNVFIVDVILLHTYLPNYPPTQPITNRLSGWVIG